MRMIHKVTCSAIEYSGQWENDPRLPHVTLWIMRIIVSNYDLQNL